jgi:uncharacterized protein (TIGR04255 family)
VIESKNANVATTVVGALPKNLPEYRKPPVVEVAISVQFEDLEGFQPLHFGLLWERFQERYPKTEHHPPLPSRVELFGARGQQQATLSMQSEFPVGRTWFQSADGLRLIQVQRDRFTLNWRKQDTDAEYPRYETLKAEFRAELDSLLSFVSEHRLGEFTPTQCELTYVNHIPIGQGWSQLKELSQVVSLCGGDSRDQFLPDLEGTRLLWHYRFEEQGSPLGRLYVQLQSALQSDQRPVLVLQLVARGEPIGDGLMGTLAFADRAHEWIVRGFTAITTERMHRIWERTR